MRYDKDIIDLITLHTGFLFKYVTQFLTLTVPCFSALAGHWWLSSVSLCHPAEVSGTFPAGPSRKPPPPAEKHTCNAINYSEYTSCLSCLKLIYVGQETSFVYSFTGIPKDLLSLSLFEFSSNSIKYLSNEWSIPQKYKIRQRVGYF